MGATAIAIPYVVFVWWFSTGAVLALVGLAARHPAAFKWGTAAAFVAALSGVAVSSQAAEDANAYCAFTCAILLWGTVEMSLLAGWITGPRPEPCPGDCTPASRVGFALQAIAYHELALIATAGLVFAVTSGAPNRLSWWTFAALLVLRQSAKINLFLGVRTLNDELLPQQVRFMRSYFAKKSINLLFPFSIAAATTATVLVAAAALGAKSTFDGVALSLLASLIALGLLEHGFMALPMPVINLWRWSAPAEPVMAAVAALPASLPVTPMARPVLAVVPATPEAERPMPAPKTSMSAQKTAAALARQRLEEQFRQAYRQARADAQAQTITGLAAVSVTPPVDPNTTAQGGVP
ncbi:MULTISPECIES: putative photosynthetic complex assembly protein PuhE [unclassified Bradyrhizobium]|uniref:putative photosynthetic complex assembly protein PuhE n=1 Tax=unclassified Bradyrhizobium TaxID=2631580 RepID=UPI0028EE84DB|nr:MULTISPECIES: putative photosynthetic complex assembly protein PuhE [unclassified Bradyrhizobium]